MIFNRRSFKIKKCRDINYSIKDPSMTNNFAQPILYHTFQTKIKNIKCEAEVNVGETYPSNNENAAAKDIIQFSRNKGVFVMRLVESSLYFFSTQSLASLRFELNFQINHNLLAAPETTENPFCFVASSNHVFKIDYADQDQETQLLSPIFSSSTIIRSIFANDKYLFIGDSSNTLTCISCEKINQRFSVLIDSNFILNIFVQKQILAISGFRDLIYIVTSAPSLVIFDQNARRSLFSTQLDISYDFSNDVICGGGLINGKNVVGILSNKILHIISIENDFSSFSIRPQINLSSPLSFAVHNNSLVVIETENDIESDYKISIYKNFDSDPSFEWSMLKEIDFLCQLSGPPSEIGEERKDRINNLYKIYATSEITEKFSPNCIHADRFGNLWSSLESSVQYFVPISEEIAVFRGLSNSFYSDADNEENFGAEIGLVDNNSIENIISIIDSLDISFSDFEKIAGHEITDTSSYVRSQISGKSTRKSLINQIRNLLFEREKERKVSIRLGLIARKVYNEIPPYLHSYIDSHVLHQGTSTSKLLFEAAEKFEIECPEVVDQILDEFKANSKIIVSCLKHFKIDSTGRKDIQPFLSFVDFWHAAVYGQSFQTFKFASSLLIAVYLAKRASQSPTRQLEHSIDLDGFSQFTTDLEDIVQKFASIYQICHCENAHLEFDLYRFSFSTFHQALSAQYYNILTDVNYLFRCIEGNSSENEIVLFAAKMKTPNHILVLALAHLYQKNSDQFLAAFNKFKGYGLPVLPLFAKLVAEKTMNNNQEKDFVYFIKESDKNLMSEYFDSFFRSAIKIQDFGAAFTSLTNNITENGITAKNITAIEILANSMVRKKCSKQFFNFAFGINRSKFLRVMTVGSTVSVFFAATLFNRCGEYSKSAGALLNFVNSVLSQSDPKSSDISKAKTALILISSLMKNHDVYVRNPTTRKLFHLRDVSALRCQLTLIKEISQETIRPKSAAFLISNRDMSSTKTSAITAPTSSITTITNNINSNNNSNNSNDNSSDLQAIIKSYTNPLFKDNLNVPIYRFIESLKSEEAMQQFFAIYLNDKYLKGESLGLWIHFLFAQHNFQGMLSILQEFKKNNRSPKALKMVRCLIGEIVNARILNDQVTLLIPSFTNQSSRQSLRMMELMINSRGTQCTNPTAYSISTNYKFSLTEENESTNIVYICCPRGKALVRFSNQGEDIYGNMHLLLNQIKGQVTITGKEDHTLVLVIKTAV